MDKELNELQKKNNNINRPTKEGTREKMLIAKKNKNDEFYTRIEDIERELKYYRKHFKDKTVLLNCDDPEWSSFYKYFYDQFNFLGLKKVISTHYEFGAKSFAIEVTRGDRLPIVKKTNLEGDGDFRSAECIEFLKEADIVVTNPPFSLFREYIAQLIEYDKKLLVIGNNNAITYKEIFKLIISNELWIGKSGRVNTFYKDIENKIETSAPACWFTNLGKPSDREHFPLWEKYEGNENRFKKFDNYDAINVNISKDIPFDYAGVMGVPITFLHKLSTDQFEIVGLANRSKENAGGLNINKYQTQFKGKSAGDYKECCLPLIKTDEDLSGTTEWFLSEDGTKCKVVYARLLIRNKKPGIEG